MSEKAEMVLCLVYATIVRASEEAELIYQDHISFVNSKKTELERRKTSLEKITDESKVWAHFCPLKCRSDSLREKWKRSVLELKDARTKYEESNAEYIAAAVRKRVRREVWNIVDCDIAVEDALAHIAPTDNYKFY
jgi:hypothetical protein